jgi:hypothetical protein
MAIDYQNVCKIIALAAAQIEGGDAQARESALQVNDISTKMDGTDVPYTALKIHVLAVEKELAEMVGNSNNAIYRSALKIQSEPVASGAEVPTANASNIPFIGAYDGIFDAETDTPLTEMPVQWVRRRIANPNTFFRIPMYVYAVQGTLIMHTVEEAYFRGCGWDYATQSAAFDALGTSPLPQALELRWAFEVLAGLAQEGWFIDESGIFRALAVQKQQAIASGKYELLAMPQIPSKSASVNPAKD